MKCLAVNTATKELSIAIVDGERVLYHFQSPEMRDQGNMVLSHIQQGLSKNSITFADLDLLAVVTGPGSFTGIRVGLATMRGIAMAAKKPLIGLSSFEMFAVPGVTNIIAVESWRDELYLAVNDDAGSPLIECLNKTPEVLAERYQPQGSVVISGDAKETAAKVFPHASLAPQDGDAVNLARLALKKFQSGVAFERPIPYYLREADVTISTKTSRTLAAKET